MGMSEVPPVVTAALERLKKDLESLAGDNLKGLILYGGCARGRFTPGLSDVNVCILLRDAGAEAVAKIAPVLHAAFRSIRLEPFLLTPAEVARAADVFPTKLLDIRDHHVVLMGEDPFAGLSVDREHIRLRVEQELRNFAFRLRRRLIAIRDDPDALARALGEIASPLAVELLALLRLAKKPAPGPAEETTETILAAAAKAFDLDSEALAKLPLLRRSDGDEGTAAIYGRVLAAISRAADVADELEEVKP